MKTVIRIITQAIRIRLPKKVWIVVQQQSDSNPSSTDLNPNSSKRYFDGLIRITIQVIWIPNEEEVKLKATDSNHLYNDSNPSWRTSEEIEAHIRITYTAIQIFKFRLRKYKCNTPIEIHPKFRQSNLYYSSILPCIWFTL